MTAYTVVNGTQSQITPTAGVTVDPLTSKDGITLTNAEVAAALGTAGVAVLKNAPGQALRRVVFGKAAGAKVSKSYVDEVLADSPVGYWRMDENGSTAISDSSGNGHTGTLWGSDYTQHVAGLLGTDADTALQINNPTFSSVDPGTGVDLLDGVWHGTRPWTLECWAKLNSINPNGVADVLLGELEGLNAIELYSGSGSDVAVLMDGGNITSIPNDFMLPAGTELLRHHYAFTNDGTTGKLYVDGALVAHGASQATVNSISVLGLGNMPQAGDGSNFSQLDAVVDEAAVYATALSAARIAAHYNAGA